MRKFIILAALIVLPVVAVGDDLLKVEISGRMETEILRATEVEPVCRIQGGYLVLADETSAALLFTSGLKYNLMAGGVEKDELALDRRHDGRNLDRYPLLFEEGRLRLLHVGSETPAAAGVELDFIPMTQMKTEIAYRPPPKVDLSRLSDIMNLDSLAALVNQDSVQTYLEAVASHFSRWVGSLANQATRSWLIDKLTSFGYQSVATDTFIVNMSGTPVMCHNIIVTKTGAKYPGLQIVVGAHYDCLIDTPGANDNASGAAALVECARILKNIETDVTFVFVLFDAEDAGLLGSEYYSGWAHQRGDSILLMVNMDCVGYYDCNSMAFVEYGDDSTLAVTFRSLADSLADLDVLMMGGGGGPSDQMSFYNKGYEVLFPHEYSEETWVSPYINTVHDSLCYVDPGYITRIAKSTLAASYVFSRTLRPMPLSFTYPKGIPCLLSPGYPTAIEILIEGGWDCEVIPGTVRMYYAFDGDDYASSDMTEIVPGLYRADLPAADCGSICTFYFSAEATVAGTQYDRSPADPYRATVATSRPVIFTDDFETDRGWTVIGDPASGDWPGGPMILTPVSA